MRRMISCSLAFALSISPVFAAEWVGFRGPVPANLEAKDLPLTWTPEEHIRWSTQLTGTGQSSPVIWGDQIYVTSVEGPNKEQCLVTAYAVTDGKKRWQSSVKNATLEVVSGLISKAAPTAVVDQAGIVALFEGGNVLARTHSGEKRWERDLVADYGPIESRHGLGSSLIQTDTHVVIWIERAESPYILCCDKATGKEVWKTEGLGATSWSSPVLLTVGGNKQLVFSATGKLRGVDPETGKELWTLEGVSGNATPSPSVAGDGLLLLGATDGRGESSGGKAADSNCLIRVKKDDSGAYSADFVWRAKRATCSFGSPIVHKGYAYFVNRTGILFCLDASTGEEVYAERTPESCWATPLAVGDRIYLVGQKGTTTVIKAGPKFEVLSQNRLWKAEAPTESPAGDGTRGSERREGSAPMSGDSNSGSGSQQSPQGRGERGAGVGGSPYGNDSQIQFAVAAIPDSLFIRTGDRLFCISK